MWTLGDSARPFPVSFPVPFPVSRIPKNSCPGRVSGSRLRSRFSSRSAQMWVPPARTGALGGLVGMDTQLELQALPHPDPKVRRFGFDLTDPYVEQCWGAVVGPSGIAILRRLPVLWTHQEPAHMPPDELARTLGLGPGTGLRGRFNRALERLTQFRLAEWVEHGAVLGIYTEVGPLSDRQVSRQSERTRGGRTNGCWVITSTGSPRLRTTAPRSPRSPPGSTASSDPPRRCRRARPSDDGPGTHRRRRGRVPVGPPNDRPDPRIRRAHICRFPYGEPASRSRSGRP